MKIRAVLDANVVADALEADRAGRASAERALLRFVLDKGIRLATHPRLRGECEHALRERKLPSTTKDGIDVVKRMIDPLRSEVLPPTPAPQTHRCKDPADNWVLDAAMRGRADVLATSDGELLALNGEFRFPILRADRARALLETLLKESKETG